MKHSCTMQYSCIVQRGANILPVSKEHQFSPNCSDSIKGELTVTHFGGLGAHWLVGSFGRS
jgi:hypothetical protein